MTPESLRNRWRAGETAFGLWSAMTDSFALELAAQSDLDYICLDQQHGMVDIKDLVALLPAIERHGVVPITRVPVNEASIIGKSLDAGALGVVVPMVSTAAEAEAAVAACRYAPDGARSFGPIRAAITMESTDPEILGSALCIVMVETEEGIGNLPDIAATPGIDAIYVGPADLGLGLGVEPTLEPTSNKHSNAITAIAESCIAAGIVAGIQCSDGASAKDRAQEGFRMITFAKDTAVLRSAVHKELSIAKGVAPETSVGRYT